MTAEFTFANWRKKMSRMSEAFTELQSACTWNEVGIHFTESMDHFEYLESVGLIQIHRPIHDATGIAYSQEYWSLEVTALGQNLVTGEAR